ncbi:hypothetical protein PPBDW_I21613 [Photobacterium kishitanii]|nr:hypothetical protein PPBDW_I21613 [Photobacterium kishitanii]
MNMKCLHHCLLKSLLHYSHIVPLPNIDNLYICTEGISMDMLIFSVIFAISMSKSTII